MSTVWRCGFGSKSEKTHPEKGIMVRGSYKIVTELLLGSYKIVTELLLLMIQQLNLKRKKLSLLDNIPYLFLSLKSELSICSDCHFP